jgi:hypothetical protein
MSDGPHRSLPMRNGWRKLAERAANTNFEPTEISEAIPIAIKDDWDAEGCDQTVRELRNILELAGTLHLDHLAWLKQSPLGEHVLATNASRLEKPLKISNSEARANLDNLLSQHRREWKSFVNSLGPTSFIRNWAG